MPNYKINQKTKKTPTNTSTNPFTDYLKDLDARLGIETQDKVSSLTITMKGNSKNKTTNTFMTGHDAANL